MKKALLIVPLVATLVGCASVKEVEVRKTAAQPKWYADCVQKGKEGFFWAREGFVYACGMGVSKHIQASEDQADLFALDSFAKRIGSRVNSLSRVEVTDENKSSVMRTERTTNNTLIQDQLESEKYQYQLGDKYHTYVRLKMSEDTFNRLKGQ